MAKQMVYFNATKQIETVTLHYNQKLDGAFVLDVERSIKDIAKKMSKIDLKNPKEFDSIQVFIYPSKQLFYKMFGGEIEKRFYSRRRSLEDLYVVQDSDGNIHIVSPRGMSYEKREEFKKILVMKVLGEYMEENEKQGALRLLKQAMKPKEKEESEEQEVEEIDEVEEQEIEQDIEEIDEPEDQDIEQETEDIDELEEQETEQGIEDIDEADEQEVDEIIETQKTIELIDEKQEKNENIKEDQKESSEEQEELDEQPSKRSEAQDWLSIGWLAYVRGRLKKEQDIKRFAENISKNGIRKIGQLSKGKWFEQYNYSEEYACAWVECIIAIYGMKKFAEYYENPKEITRIFGVPKFVFESQVKAYIKEKYKDNEKVLNITEDISLDKIINENEQEKENKEPVAEITALHFSPNGGVDILSDAQVIEKDTKVRE